jgi:DNA-binding Xre family transcriptional regulator
MMQTVQRHDLAAICAACGTSLRDLAQATGLSQETLRSFAGAVTPLSATNRLAIWLFLAERSLALSDAQAPWRTLSANAHQPSIGVVLTLRGLREEAEREQDRRDFY